MSKAVREVEEASSQFRVLRETARKRSLERIRELLEHEAEWEDVEAAIIEHAIAFKREYGGTC